MPKIWKNLNQKHGRPQKLIQGGKLEFCLSFPCWWRCNANARSQNTSTFLHHNEKPLATHGRSEGGKRSKIPRLPNPYGCQITAGSAIKPRQCHKYFFQYSAFASERSQVWRWGRQTCFLPRAPSNLVALLLPQQQSQKSRFVSQAMLLFHSCFFSHCTVQNYEAYHY